MKKTLRFIALLGVIASTWMLAEPPSQAVVTCGQLPATCTPGTRNRCYEPAWGEWFVCLCPNGYWECY